MTAVEARVPPALHSLYMQGVFFPLSSKVMDTCASLRQEVLNNYTSKCCQKRPPMASLCLVHNKTQHNHVYVYHPVPDHPCRQDQTNANAPSSFSMSRIENEEFVPGVTGVARRHRATYGLASLSTDNQCMCMANHTSMNEPYRRHMHNNNPVKPHHI